jgi:hypothetical protein
MSAPRRIDAAGGKLVVAAGNMARDGKLELVIGDDERRTLVSGELVDYPQLEGDWVYFQDGRYRLARVPVKGGAPEIVRAAIEDPRLQAFGLVQNDRYLIWLEGGAGRRGGEAQGDPEAGRQASLIP